MQFAQTKCSSTPTTPALRLPGIDDEDSLPDEALSLSADSSVNVRSRENEGPGERLGIVNFIRLLHQHIPGIGFPSR